MTAILRWVAFAALASSVSGYLLGEMPSQTLAVQTVGMGMPLRDIMPTEAPSMELVKKHLEKKAITNTCSEWSVLNGGIPYCGYSETCLFTTATDGYMYEGCGHTSLAYNWVTLCSPYPQTATGTVPVSEVWCPSSAPACGYYAFELDALHTFYDFGCSSTSYFSTVVLVSTSSKSTSDFTLAGGGTTKITQAPTVTVTQLPPTFKSATAFKSGSAFQSITTFKSAIASATYKSASGGPGTSSAGSSSSSSLPTIKSHQPKKKVPIGAIIGGVLGGVAIIAFGAFMTWYCLRRHRKGPAPSSAAPGVQQHPGTGSAFQSTAQNPHHRISELGHSPAAAPPTIYAGHHEKPGLYTNTQELIKPATENELPTDQITPRSPPPRYASPTRPSSSLVPAYSPNNFAELGTAGRQSGTPGTPVSPETGIYPSVITPLLSNSNPNTMSELPSPQQRESYNASPSTQTHSGGHEIQGTSRNSDQSTQALSGAQELHSANYAAYPPNQTHTGPQEMQGAAYVAYPPNQVSPGTQEMSGVGRVQRRPVPQSSGVDMSGAPLGDNWDHHELP